MRPDERARKESEATDTYHEVRVDALDVDPLAADLFSERAAERREEGLGSRVSAEHGRRDAHTGE